MMPLGAMWMYRWMRGSMQMKLFISYRRNDSMHAAHRVRLLLVQKFGGDSVFIDREIPAGREWAEHIRAVLATCSGVVVMVGDEFLRRLSSPRGDDDADPMVWEISLAIELGKPIYPVLFGTIDMPHESRLPAPIRRFARYQAVFAREPAFDTAVGTMIKSIADDHGFVGGPPPDVARNDVPPGRRSGLLALLASALVVATVVWGIGRLILWLALGDAAQARPAESAFWHGLRYVLATAVWGLGPYLAYRQVADLRARARLPIRNAHGMLAMLNVAGVLVLGGTFLLLSTVHGWRLKPLWIFPDQPAGHHYALLAAGMMTMVAVAVIVAVLEPRIRALSTSARAWGMGGVTVVGYVLVAFVAWLAASLVASLPDRVFDLADTELVAMIGFPVLCLALSPLMAAYHYARSTLGMRTDDWHNVALLAIVLGLALTCTLALFAYGPTRLLAGGI